MSKNWQYGTYTQSERYNMIRNGNRDVYNSEKARNKSLRAQLSALGLSTDDVDGWDKTVDTAYNLSRRTYSKKDKYEPTVKSVPRTEDALYGMYARQMNDLRRKLGEQSSAAVNEAAKELSGLDEWLANNGYSETGSLSARERKKTSSVLESYLEELTRAYERDASEVERQLDEALRDYKRALKNNRISKAKRRAEMA